MALEAIKLKRKEFFKLVTDTVGVTEGSPWHTAVDLGLAANLGLFAEIRKLGGKILIHEDEDILGDNESGKLKAIFFGVGNDGDVPFFAAIYPTADGLLGTWSPYIDVDVSKINRLKMADVLAQFGNIPDRDHKHIERSVLKMLAQTAYNKFVHEVRFVDDVVAKPTTQLSAPVQVDEDEDVDPSDLVDEYDRTKDDGRDEFFEPVKLDAKLEAKLLAIQGQLGGKLKASSDVDEFKRKLMEVVDNTTEHYNDEFGENLVDDLLNMDENVFVDDIKRVQFDFENRFLTGDCFDGIKVGYHVVGNLSFLIGYAGGDWEFPVIFAVYLGEDGEIHGYVPSDGNVYEHAANCAYGSIEASMIPGSENLGRDKFDEKYNNIDNSFEAAHVADYEQVLADIIGNISVA